MKFKSKMTAAIVLALSLGGCATAADQEFFGHQDTGFGEANRATFATMVVNPDPEYDTPIPAGSAANAAAAIERYRNDKVKKPERVSTTEGGGNN